MRCLGTCGLECTCEVASWLSLKASVRVRRQVGSTLVEYKVGQWYAENLTACNSLLTFITASQEAPRRYVAATREAAKCPTLYSTNVG